jgi:hypothetical protein
MFFDVVKGKMDITKKIETKKRKPWWAQIKKKTNIRKEDDEQGK